MTREPKRGETFRLTFPLVASGADHFMSEDSLTQQLISNVSKDHGTWASTANRVRSIGNGIYYLDLTVDEMTAAVVLVTIKTQYANGPKDVFFELHTYQEMPLIYGGMAADLDHLDLDSMPDYPNPLSEPGVFGRALANAQRLESPNVLDRIRGNDSPELPEDIIERVQLRPSRSIQPVPNPNDDVLNWPDGVMRPALSAGDDILSAIHDLLSMTPLPEPPGDEPPPPAPDPLRHLDMQ